MCLVCRKEPYAPASNEDMLKMRDSTILQESMVAASGPKKKAQGQMSLSERAQ